MQALWKPVKGGIRLTDVLPDGKHEDMPDGHATNKARQQAYRHLNQFDMPDGIRRVLSTQAHIK